MSNNILQNIEPWEMAYDAFELEFTTLMQSVADKQYKGKMDSAHPNYKEITLEEYELIKHNWKEFSRQRGFSEDDIQEYERWITISGRRDFDNADTMFDEISKLGLKRYLQRLHIKFIDFAEDSDIVIRAAVVKSYDEVKSQLKN